MIEAELPDGTVLEFPAGTSPDVVQRVVKQRLGVAANPVEQKSMLGALGGSIGQGVGNVALGAQNLMGMGLEKLGADQVGQWLQKDAAQGKAKLQSEIQPYEQQHPLTVAGGRLGGEVLGTLPVGGALAKGVGAIPSASKYAAPLVEALRTGGFSAGGLTGAKGAAIRAGAGAVGGGVSAGMVNPEEAATGAMIGGALPGVGKLAGEAGKKIGSVLRGPQASDDVLNAAKQAFDAGYIIPPTQVKPTLGNRLLEGLSGKITTAQNASAKNTEVTNKLAAKALGLGDDVKLTPDVLNDIRKTAGTAYREVASLPVKPAQEANSLMNIPAAPEVDPSKMVFDLRKARNDATAWYNSYGRTADPDSLAKAKAAKALATELEGTLEGYAKSLGRDDLVSDMAKSRELIAKTYSVEKALNTTTGNVDAKNLAKQLDKGKPLSGELKQVAEFAARFPKASQTIEGMGSLPQTSPLDWAAFGGIGAATANPLMLLGVGARPLARAAVLSNPVQRGLQTAPSQISPQVIEALRRGALAAPVVATSQ